MVYVNRVVMGCLSRNTRAIDVVNYIRNEANLNIRCDPIATRYNTYQSYYIHALLNIMLCYKSQECGHEMFL